MDKPLAQEYVDRRKWFTYEVFEKLKYGKEENIQDCREESRKDQQSGDNHSYFDEEEKDEEESVIWWRSVYFINWKQVKQNQFMMIIEVAWIH